ncbi:MAG TPA: hypothetical protein VFU89_08615 [Rhabdochlamydiaceae bacterium]|nr:hypothetical protein [Rhabdochlamydiaceae bacterium]
MAGSVKVQEERMQALEAEVAALMERNKRVDQNKAWEIGNVRKAVLFGTTYVAMVGLFAFADYIEYAAAGKPMAAYRPFVLSMVPTCAFFISTLALNCIRTNCCS